MTKRKQICPMTNWGFSYIGYFSTYIRYNNQNLKEHIWQNPPFDDEYSNGVVKERSQNFNPRTQGNR